MESPETPFCSDEELLQELKNLGYHDVSADAFLMMKKDLSRLVLQDEGIPNTCLKIQVRDKDDFIPSQKSSSSSSFLNGKSPTFIVDRKAPFHRAYHPAELDSTYLHNKKNHHPANSTEETESSDTSSDSLRIDVSLNADLPPTSFARYKERLNAFKAAQRSKLDASADSSRVSLEGGNRIKRKVLRHRNGKPVVTEEFLEIPVIFNTSYPETENSDANTTSSEDASFQSNESTSNETPRSTVSSTRSRKPVPRKKKNDPVAMYNFYKKFWNDFKPPGEKTHDKLRWAVRDRMLDYSL